MHGKRRGSTITNVDGELKRPGNDALMKRNTTSAVAFARIRSVVLHCQLREMTTPRANYRGYIIVANKRG